jgi:hypothetical protein
MLSGVLRVRLSEGTQQDSAVSGMRKQKTSHEACTTRPYISALAILCRTRYTKRRKLFIHPVVAYLHTSSVDTVWTIEGVLTTEHGPGTGHAVWRASGVSPNNAATTEHRLLGTGPGYLLLNPAL